MVRQWLLPAVYERMRTGRGEFLAELRTAVPLFLSFGGIDFDTDPEALTKLDAFMDSPRSGSSTGTAAAPCSSPSATRAPIWSPAFGTALAHATIPRGPARRRWSCARSVTSIR